MTSNSQYRHILQRFVTWNIPLSCYNVNLVAKKILFTLYMVSFSNFDAFSILVIVLSGCWFSLCPTFIRLLGWEEHLHEDGGLKCQWTRCNFTKLCSARDLNHRPLTFKQQSSWFTVPRQGNLLQKHQGSNPGLQTFNYF